MRKLRNLTHLFDSHSMTFIRSQLPSSNLIHWSPSARQSLEINGISSESEKITLLPRQTYWRKYHGIKRLRAVLSTMKKCLIASKIGLLFFHILYISQFHNVWQFESSQATELTIFSFDFFRKDFHFKLFSLFFVFLMFITQNYVSTIFPALLDYFQLNFISKYLTITLYLWNTRDSLD